MMNAQPIYGTIQPNPQYDDTAPVIHMSWSSVIFVFMIVIWFLFSIIKDGKDICDGSDVSINSIIMISKLSVLSIVVYWIMGAIRDVEPMPVLDINIAQ
jgi:uncharacterized MnhB-related membrane protein